MRNCQLTKSQLTTGQKVKDGMGTRSPFYFLPLVPLGILRALTKRCFNRTAHFFAFSWITEAPTEKVLEFIMTLKSSYNKNLGFIEQKCIFEHYREVLTIKNLLIDIIFVMKIFSSGPFQSCLYRFMMVLNKNVLCYCSGFYHSLWPARIKNWSCDPVSRWSMNQSVQNAWWEQADRQGRK